jgi:hypothetical protein
LVQSGFDPLEHKSFGIRDEASGLAAEPNLRTYGRFVPERKDDFAWENDVVAFRMYGPALAVEGSNSGVDCWLKRVKYPIVDKWYRLDQQGTPYHTDHGEGYDPYHVGKGRGCGGMAYWDGSRLYNTSVFSTWKVVANGPIRTVFELSYAPITVQGKKIEEVKRVSLDLGSRLNRFDIKVKADGRPDQVDFAIGLATHAGKATSSFSDHRDWMANWEKIDDSDLGTGVVIAPDKLIEFKVHGALNLDDHHALAVTSTDQNGEASYYAGYGWKKAGEILSLKDWQNYLADFAARRASPLVYAY